MAQTFIKSGEEKTVASGINLTVAEASLTPLVPFQVFHNLQKVDDGVIRQTVIAVGARDISVAELANRLTILDAKLASDPTNPGLLTCKSETIEDLTASSEIGIADASSVLTTLETI